MNLKLKHIQNRPKFAREINLSAAAMAKSVVSRRAAFYCYKTSSANTNTLGICPSLQTLTVNPAGTQSP
jgi:hypothetical protein